MIKTRIRMDFNCVFEKDLYPLSNEDLVKGSNGKIIALHEGMEISVYDEDWDENDKRDDLIADGIVEKNARTDYSHVKWNIRINEKGIYHTS